MVKIAGGLAYVDSPNSAVQDAVWSWNNHKKYRGDFESNSSLMNRRHQYNAPLNAMTNKVQTPEESNDPRIGACVYLLHGLLQRLEKQQAGLLADMTLGVASDRAAMNPERSLSEKKGCEIADEALRMLRLMSAQLTVAAHVPDKG